MPKRGGGRHQRQYNSDSSHFEHDDRAGGTRKVSFKTSNKGKNKVRAFTQDPSKFLNDGDIDMSVSMTSRPRSFHRGRGGRLNSPGPKFHKRSFVPGMLPWYQITIPYGAKHEKETVLKSLLSYVSPEVFIPHYYKTDGNAAIFYVDDVKSAEVLYNADRKIMMPDGFKLIVLVKNSLPNVKVDDNLKEKMKLAMAKRYNAATKALDLTKFHADPELIDVFCALFRPVVMVTAIDIIADNIPDLEALNLNDNKLHGMEHMKVLVAKLKSLKILYLGDNKIPHTGALDSLKGLPLVELYLKGNPLSTRFRDPDLYVSEIRKKFPKLMKLDGEDLPPTIVFDLSSNVELPPAQQSFLVDLAGKDLVREFLTQYFAIYDSDSRQPLLEAYHEHACMSLTSNYLSNDARNVPSTRLNSYIPCSRNLMRVTDREARRKQLHIGRLNVVSFLSNLPKSTHDLMGCNVDLTVFTTTMLMLTMNGVFKERMEPGTPLRFFHRTFVVVPNGVGGLAIMNDTLCITNIDPEQEKEAFKTPIAVPAPAPTPVPMAPVPAPVPIQQPALDDAQKMQAIAMLGQQTGMNDNWSLNCLQETEWDMQRALFIFTKLNSEGKIPPAAFVK